MKNLLLCLVVCLFLHQYECKLGVDVSQLYSVTTYQCMKNNGRSFAVIRGYRSYGGIDTNCVKGLENAKSAGLITDIYMFPCRAKSASSQVSDMMSKISANLYGMVWIDVETNPSSGCGWGKDYSSNCAYLTDLVNQIKAKGKAVGIYASYYQWESIMGSVSACTGLASQPLWYAHYDNNPSFTDFKAFGGWKKPNIKQYKGDTKLCGVDLDENYYP